MGKRDSYYEITPTPSNGFFISTSHFVEEFKDELKEAVPWQKRRWDSDENAWWVHEDYMDTVRQIAEEHFDEEA